MSEDKRRFKTKDEAVQVFDQKVEGKLIELLRILKEEGFQFVVSVEHDSDEGKRFCSGCIHVNGKYSSPALIAMAEIYSQYAHKPDREDLPGQDVDDELRLNAKGGAK